MPAWLAGLPVWLVWRWLPGKDGGKPRKFPHYVRGGGWRGTWNTAEDIAGRGTLAEALGLLDPPSAFVGLGLVSGHVPGGLYLHAADFDHVADSGTADLVAQAPGYVELSPSGTGAHVLGLGRRTVNLRPRGGIEFYNDGQFVTFTGEVIRDAAGPVCLAAWAEQVLVIRHGGAASAQPAARDATGRKLRAPSRPDNRTPEQIATSFYRCQSGAHGVRCVRAWNGEDVMGNASDNDWLVLFQLCLLTRDDELVLEVFARSPLWGRLDRKCSGDSEKERYVRLTIDNARAARYETDTAWDAVLAARDAAL